MADYSKAVIYTIRSGDSVYVGSTINFASRKYDHKKAIYDENNKKYNRKLYKTIRENDGEWDMQPYSQFPCNCNIELTIEEERVRQLLNADMNMRRCGTCSTKTEYYYKYREENNKKREQYYQLNKKSIIENVKEYRLKNLEKIKETKQKNYQLNKGLISEKQKLYRDKNKDIISEKKKIYHDKNKDIISERKKIKMTCGCGTTCRKNDLARHKRSKKHLEWEKNK
jgi:hypothetical protein